MYPLEFEVGMFQFARFTKVKAFVVIFFICFGVSQNSIATDDNVIVTTKFIVTFSPSTHRNILLNKASSISTLQQLSIRQNKSLRYDRRMSGGAHVISLYHTNSSPDSIAQAMQELNEDANVLNIELDAIVHPLMIPGDHFYPEQWSLHESTEVPAGMNLPRAWELTTGSENTIVAVIDTGILADHVDLAGKVLDGYDFIREFEVGNDTLKEEFPSYLTYFRTNDEDGRDNDPADPGDWIEIDDIFAMSSVGVECFFQDSTFHGTGIASIIAGNSDHGDGIAGIDWSAKILPVRVSGKCGGSRSDMIDAIRWAAGISDPALPDNPHPAKVINLSLGSNNPCGFGEQTAINDAYNAGVIIVAAAGNIGKDLAEFPTAPAVCNHVIAVAAVNYEGNRTFYSNFGSAVDISAPGGENPQNDGQPIIIASNNGLKSPIEGSHFKFVSGTSAATAHVSGVISLMLGANPELTPFQVEQLLQQSARTFPSSGVLVCDSATCGSGMVDAEAAVTAAINGFVEGHDPVLETAEQSQPVDDRAEIITGGAGNMSLALYLMLIFMSIIKLPAFRRFY